jgi:NAD(P)-dependent dehydrogenase (short-subunit alcohol dehydrogenase family)
MFVRLDAKINLQQRAEDNSMAKANPPAAKVWLITGSSRGLGRALAEAVLACGYKLAATARDPRQLQDLVERYGDQVRTIALDVTSEAAAMDAVNEAITAFGRLDVIANNAGYGDVCPIEDMSMIEFRAQLETNLFGVIHVTKAALPFMREQGSGHFLQFSNGAWKVSLKCCQKRSRLWV